MCLFFLEEAEILFPPTYRIKKGSLDQYVVEKIKSSGVGPTKYCIHEITALHYMYMYM